MDRLEMFFGNYDAFFLVPIKFNLRNDAAIELFENNCCMAKIDTVYVDEYSYEDDEVVYTKNIVAMVSLDVLLKDYTYKRIDTLLYGFEAPESINSYVKRMESKKISVKDEEEFFSLLEQTLSIFKNSVKR